MPRNDVVPSGKSGGYSEGGLEDKIGSFSVKRAHGKTLSDTMGNLLFHDTIIAVIELVSNSYDADAAHVDINYDHEGGTLVISDNGDGMDKKGIESFYRMGDSEKITNPISRKGRKKIGEYGLATIALKKLCLHYLLETRTAKSKRTLTVDEIFKDKNDDDKKLQVNTKKEPRKERGTSIFMDKLKFIEQGLSFSEEELMRRLSLELPISKDFTINVNGKSVNPKDMRNSIEYVIDVDDQKVGRVYGSIYYSKRKLGKDAGIFIKVHGRSVGGTNIEVFGKKVKEGLARRMYGVIHADGLKGIIGLNRETFQKDDPKFKKVADYILEILKQIRRDTEKMQTNYDVRSKKEELEKTMQRVGKDIIELMNSEGEPYMVSLSRGKGGKVAEIDHGKRVLYINPESPTARLSKVGRKELREKFLELAKYGIVRSLLTEGKQRDIHESLELRTANELARVHKFSLATILEREEEDIEVTETGEISQNRAYTYTEITKITNWSNALLKRMANAEIIKSRHGEKVLGKDITQARTSLAGHLPFYEALRKVYPQGGGQEDQNFLARTEGRIIKDLAALQRGYEAKGMGIRGQRKKLTEVIKIPPYLKNLGIEKNSFWVVNEENLIEFEEFVKTGKFSKGGVLSDPSFVYTKIPGEGGGIITYAMKVNGDMDPKNIREINNKKISVMRELGDEGDLPLGIRYVSWCASYNEKKTVVGIIVGDSASPIKEIGSLLEKTGFKRRKINIEGIKELYNSTSRQRSKAFPLVEVTEFSDTQRAIAEKLLGDSVN